MKIQLALDMFDIQHALQVATDVQSYVDIIELGTPLMKFEGVRGVKLMREKFPYHLILADLKTMDAGFFEIEPFFHAGADICTVLGVADDDTIKGAIEAACHHNKTAQVDLINVANKVERALEVHAFGADIVGIHTGIDQQNKGQTPLADLNAIINHIPAQTISVAGGIKLETLRSIINNPACHQLGIVVVGGAITSLKTNSERQHIACEMKKLLMTINGEDVWYDS